MSLKNSYDHMSRFSLLVYMIQGINTSMDYGFDLLFNPDYVL